MSSKKNKQIKGEKAIFTMLMLRKMVCLINALASLLKIQKEKAISKKVNFVNGQKKQMLEYQKIIYRLGIKTVLRLS